MPAASLTHPEETEDDVVRQWRYDALVTAGYEEDDAVELAFHIDVDLHWAVSLVHRGCPSATALRIAL